MPRRERAEIYYTCGNCSMTDTSLPLHLCETGDYAQAVMLLGPGWELLLEEEWFCNTACFLAWLAEKMVEAASEATPDDEYVSGWDVYGGLKA